MKKGRAPISTYSFASFYVIFFLITLLHFLGLGINLFSKQNKQTSSQLDVKKIRLVGIENSQKRTVFLPQKVKPAKKSKTITQKVKTKRASLSKKNLNFKSLSINKKKIKKDFSFNALKLDNKQMKQLLKQNSYRGESQFSSKDFKLLRKSGVLVQIDPPKGVKIDELNALELQFYSFQRRMAMQYINTILLKINDYRYRQPHLQFPYTQDSERLTGKLTYDNEGNLLRIQILEYAENLQLQDFFEDVLDEIGPLPNPPKSLYKETNEFSIYYSLRIQA